MNKLYQPFAKAMNEWKKDKDKRTVKSRLPNIVYLNQDGWKADIQLRTMYAMVMQEKTSK